MNKVFKITIFLLIILFGLSVIEFNLFKQQTKTASVCFEDPLTGINKGCFQVEVADNPVKRQRGLMFRTHLDKDKGMLFVFSQEGNYQFWMKNTLIPLDIIWINSNSQVAFIKENAEPCKGANCPNINPHQNAKYVLEINGGLTKKFNIFVNDKAALSY